MVVVDRPLLRQYIVAIMEATMIHFINHKNY